MKSLENKTKKVLISGNSKILFSFLLLFLLLPLVSPATPQTNVNRETGYEIIYPKFDVIKQNQPFNLSVHISNNSNGVQVTGALCDLEMFNSTGQHIINNQNLSLIGDEYNYFISAGNFTQTGIYHFNIYCSTEFFGGVADGLFEVSPSGQSGTNNLVFVLFIIFAFYTITFMGFFGKNTIISMLGGMGMIFLGVYLINNGIIVYRDDLTLYFAYLTTGIGFLIAIWAGMAEMDVL